MVISSVSRGQVGAQLRANSCLPRDRNWADLDHGWIAGATMTWLTPGAELSIC
jgi:hypothetical protein